MLVVAGRSPIARAANDASRKRPQHHVQHHSAFDWSPVSLTRVAASGLSLQSSSNMRREVDRDNYRRPDGGRTSREDSLLCRDEAARG